MNARQPDPYGIAVGDLVAGTDIDIPQSTVGEVIEIHRRTWDTHGNRYTIRTGELLATGEPRERVIHDHPKVVVPAGDPVLCAACNGLHVSADRFIECQIAHARADAERRRVAA